MRTMPSNACFSSLTSVGVPRLRRVLRGLAWLYPDIGYCQGTGMVRPPGPPPGSLRRTRAGHVTRSLGLCVPQVVSCLLLFLEEEDALWMMCALIEDLLPPSYFSSTLLGIQTDQRVLRQLIVQYLPALDRLLQEHDIGGDDVLPLHELLGGSTETEPSVRFFLLLSSELSLITLHWFLTSFASVVDIRLLLRIWDLLFYQGSLVLFQITLGMLKIQVNSQRSFTILAMAMAMALAAVAMLLLNLRRRNSYRRRTPPPFSTPCRTCQAS